VIAPTKLGSYLEALLAFIPNFAVISCTGPGTLREALPQAISRPPKRDCSVHVDNMCVYDDGYTSNQRVMKVWLPSSFAVGYERHAH
jgi:hypothetical protein